MAEYRTQLKKVVTGATQAEREAAAEAAANHIEGVIHFLAAYNFDVSRRFAIMHFALEPIRKHGKATAVLAERVRKDDKAINETLPTGSSSPDIGEWRTRSNRAWLRLDAWHDRIKDSAKAFLEASLIR
jgi:hypothetical protein